MSFANLYHTIRSAIHKRRDPVGYARSIGVKVGKDCRLINVSFSTEPWIIEIGDHVSATATRFETHDGGVWVARHLDPMIDKIAPIKIGNNVFIGYGTVILPGVEIGDNVVIGANSVVSRSIPDNSVAVGAPARVIKSTDEYMRKILKDGDRTKLMSHAEKMKYYTKKYST